MDRKSWLQERKKGLGGSDIGALFSLDYGCARALAYDKTNAQEDFPENFEEENALFERGNLIEPVIRLLYQKRTGRPTELPTPKITKSILYPFMQVSMDAITTDALKTGPGYAEFKCVNYFVMRQFKKEGIRRSYILQMQHGLAVSGYKWGSFGILCLDPWEFAYFDVDADDNLQVMLLDTEGEWWKTVVEEKTLPDPLEDPQDKRCQSCRWRRTCRGGEYSLAPTSKDERKLIHTPELLPLVSQWVDLDQLAKAAENQVETIKDTLRAAIGFNDGLTVPGAKVLVPRWDETRWETKQLNFLLPYIKELIPETLVELIDAEPEEVFNLAVKAVNLLSVISSSRKTSPKSSIRYYPSVE